MSEISGSFQRELFAPVERQLQLGQHFADDRTELFGQLVLRQSRSSFRIDALEQPRENLFLDLVYRSLEAFGFLLRGIHGVFALAQPLHGRQLFADWNRNVFIWRKLGGTDRRKLGPAICQIVRTLRGGASPLHRTRDAEGRAVAARPTRPIASSKSTHVLPSPCFRATTQPVKPHGE